MNTNAKEKGTSAIEQNKELLRKAVKEIWNKGNFNILTDMISDDFVIHFPRAGEEIRGPENVKHFYTNLRNAFPDIHFKIIDQIAEGDKIVTHWSATGTQSGEFIKFSRVGEQDGEVCSLLFKAALKQRHSYKIRE